MNTPKVHDNRRVLSFMDQFDGINEACHAFPVIDDLFTGALMLATPGRMATRTLSRKILFMLLTNCPSISTQAVHAVTRGIYSETQAKRYTQLARLISKAIGPWMDIHPGDIDSYTGTRAEQRVIDSSYRADLLQAAAQSTLWAGGGGGLVNMAPISQEGQDRAWRRLFN
ncbi:MAG: hypothetical protein V4795_02670 [Pseudomonadota bacterium]